MDYKLALDTGHKRAEQAAEALARWTGVQTYPLCAVQPAPGSDPRTKGNWEPVGQQSYKEIARDEGIYGKGNYHVLVVDENGTAKACSRKRFALADVLRLVERLPLPVAAAGWGELWGALDRKANAGEVRSRSVRAEA
jgi:hypothetical protein